MLVPRAEKYDAKHRVYQHGQAVLNGYIVLRSLLDCPLSFSPTPSMPEPTHYVLRGMFFRPSSSPSHLTCPVVSRAEGLAGEPFQKRSRPNSYVSVKLGDTKLKTREIENNLSPEWNESLTL